jgi:hypothetical protein
LQLNSVTKELQALLQSTLGLFQGSSLSSPQLRQLALDYNEGRLDPKVQSAISILIGSFAGPIESTLKENQQQLEEIIRHKRFRWTLQHVPVKIGDNQIIDAKGDYDMAEIYMLYGLTRQILGVFNLVESQDYSLTLRPLTDYVLTVNDNPVLNLTQAPGKAIVNLVAVLMATSPIFLSLESAAGAEQMKMAGANFSSGFASVLDSITFMKKREGDQSGSILEFRRDNDKDYLILHMAINNGANPIPVVDLQKFDGIAIPLDDRILEGLKNMSDDFANTPGVNTNLQRDVFPIVTLGLVVLVGSGAFDALINLALEGSDPGTKKIATDLIKLLKDNQDLVLAALVSLVPVEIEFDFGHMFQEPGGLRDVFPAWTQPANLDFPPALTEATLVYSYECADGSDALREEKYICDKEADRGHFQDLDETPYQMWDPVSNSTIASSLLWKNYSGSNNFGPKWATNVPIEADGIPTVIPYLGFKDASFNGVLYLNTETISKLKSKNGMQPATLMTLNATLATIVATVQGFL